jgi:hypothetical protein
MQSAEADITSFQPRLQSPGGGLPFRSEGLPPRTTVAGRPYYSSSFHIRGGMSSTGQGAARVTPCAVLPSSARRTAP